MADRPSRARGKTYPMTVRNLGFLIDRLGEDCAPLQDIRELTQNAIEGILALPEPTGVIRWDSDWNTYELTGIHKRAIIDTGNGMTGEEMVQYINQLSSSIREQSTTGNYGVGAKIAAAPRNRAGLVYLSWKNGIGYQVHLWRDPDTNDYGLREFNWPDGRREYWAFVEDDVKPSPIDRNGTMVLLLGNSADEDTMAARDNIPMPSRWVLRYLNGRYYEFPDGITVEAREGWTVPRDDTRHNFLRRVTGMRLYLEKSSELSGVVPLNNAVARWWILKEESDPDSGHYPPRGHLGALYQNELYEMQIGRGAMARLQEFGIVFGTGRVVLYIEPGNGKDQKLTTNTARTNLILNGQPLPWSDWAAEFREKMPPEIVSFMERLSTALPKDHSESIKERLKTIIDLFKFSRYRQVKGGPLFLDERDLLPGGASSGKGTIGGGSSTSGGGSKGGGAAGNIYAIFQAKTGVPGVQAKNIVEPTVHWISVETGTRDPGDLEDRAARYLSSQHLLHINADFRVFKDMINRWSNRYSQIRTAKPIIESVVREWFEQQLIEAILGALALKETTSQWTSIDVDTLWGEEALTAVTLPRYHVDVSVKRVLGQRLGSLKD